MFGKKLNIIKLDRVNKTIIIPVMKILLIVQYYLIMKN